MHVQLETNARNLVTDYQVQCTWHCILLYYIGVVLILSLLDHNNLIVD